MSTKAFIVLIAAAVVFGGALAGAFIAGSIVGEGRSETQASATATFFPREESAGIELSEEDAATAVQKALMEAGVKVGEKMDEGDAQQLREQIRSMTAMSAAQGGGVTGTVTSVEGSLLTVDTPEGAVTITLGDETALHQVAEMSPGDLAVGSRVAVSGTRHADGEMSAEAVTLLPEGFDLEALGLGLGSHPGVFSVQGAPQGELPGIPTRIEVIADAREFKVDPATGDLIPIPSQ